MFVSSKSILQKAKLCHYAVPAFNVSDLEMIQAIAEAAVEEKSPVIISASESAIKYAGEDYLVAITKLAAKKAKVPIVLHLDHGQSFEIARSCIDAGFTSVMIDSSHEKFEANIQLTKQVVAYAHKNKVTVEAELGTIGGAEDNVSSRNIILTDPDSAVEFVKKTKIDSLAVAVGTSHGAYKFEGESVLAYDRIVKINAMVKVPLVLHGASGLPQWLLDSAKGAGLEVSKMKGVSDDTIKKAVDSGISKVNIDTDSRIAFTVGVRSSLLKDKTLFDPRKYLLAGKELMKLNAKKKMQLLGSSGKA